jgi:hypothetical protein
MARILGITGVAKSGKDTLCEELISIFAKKGVKAKRYAMADKLKAKLNPWLIEEFDIDLYNCYPEEKEKMRPFMVEYGRYYRDLSGGRHWVDIVLDEIEWERPQVAIVTDVRFAEINPTDEYFALKDKGMELIHIEKVLKDGAVLGPPNEDEKRNDPILKSLAHHHLKLREFDGSPELLREFKELVRLFFVSKLWQK